MMPYVKDNPNIYTVLNEPKVGSGKDFFGIMTLLNLAEDDIPDFSIYLPKNMRNKNILKLTKNGRWTNVKYLQTEDCLKIMDKLDYLSPLFLMFENN